MTDNIPDDLTDYSAGTGSKASTASTSSPPTPSARQLEFHDWQMGLFIHFGLSTYTRQVSGDGTVSGEQFNPTDLSCESWMDAAEAMGARYVVYTARHEGGFCTWPTRTHDYSVANCSWRGGKGDVVAEYVEACRSRGLKVGFYHTPSHDAHCRGLYQCQHGAYNTAYIDTQVRQMTELLTRYGPIDYLWFDHHSGNELYQHVDDRVRQLQPDCLMFGQDTWIVGGHQGRADYPLWHAVNTADGQPYSRPIVIGGEPCGQYYRCWEANTIFSGNWFWWGPEIRPLAEMVELYDASVGRGANFLPNFAPDPRGRMTDEVLAAAQAFGDAIRSRSATCVGETGPGEATLELDLGTEKTFDQIVVQEDLSAGQTIASHGVEVFRGGGWQALRSGLTVGPQRLYCVPEVAASKLRVRVMNSLTGHPKLRCLACYRSA